MLLEDVFSICRQFAERVFRPFSAAVVDDGVYKELQAETSNYKTDLTNKINQYVSLISDCFLKAS